MPQAAPKSHPPPKSPRVPHSQPPESADQTPTPHDQAHGAMHALADATLAPVEAALRGHEWFLRSALLLHLLATASVAVLARQLGLTDWQLYLWMGVCVTILTANFMRWSERAGWLRRSVSTLLAVVTTLGWALLLADRARGPLERMEGQPVEMHGLLWIPVALLGLSIFGLAAHIFALGRPRRA